MDILFLSSLFFSLPPRKRGRVGKEKGQKCRWNSRHSYVSSNFQKVIKGIKSILEKEKNKFYVRKKNLEKSPPLIKNTTKIKR